MTPWRRFWRSTATNVGLLFLAMIFGLILITLLFPGQLNFFTYGNISVLSQHMPTIAILAIGAGILMIAGEFDLSINGVFVMSSYLMAIAVHRWDWPVLAAFALAVAAGALVGLANGLATLRLGVPSFIATLGMMFILQGTVRWESIDVKIGQPNQIAFNPPEPYYSLFTGQIWGPLFAQTIWLLAVAGLAFLLLNRHVLGNQIFAVGGDREAARKNGIWVPGVKVAAFVLCSTLAAFAGVLQAMRVHVIDPAQTSTGLELQAIAAAVVGGVYLFGGRGSVLGMVLGAALIALIENVLIIIRAPGEYMPVFIGSLVILSVIVNTNFGGGAAVRRGTL